MSKISFVVKSQSDNNTIYTTIYEGQDKAKIFYNDPPQTVVKFISGAFSSECYSDGDCTVYYMDESIRPELEMRFGKNKP